MRRQMTVLSGIAAVAAVGLVAQAVLGLPAEAPSDQFPTIEMYGVGEMPPVDGGDDRARFEVAVDHATLLDAASLAVATAGSTTGASGLTTNDELLVVDLSAVGWGGLVGQPLPRPVPSGDGQDIVAVRTAVAEAFDVLSDDVEQVNPVSGNRYEVVGTSLTDDLLLAINGVTAVESVGLVTPFVSNDPYVGSQWGLENTGQTMRGRPGLAGVDIGFDETRDQANGAGVVVAIVDSGIQMDHPDLAGRFWQNTDEDCSNGRDDDGNGYVDDCQGWDFVNNDATPYDTGVDNQHGTHVAGIIAATSDNGVGVASLASGATLMPLKVFQGGSSPTSRITAAIDYAVTNGAHVINLSLGGPSPSSAQQAAIDRAGRAGVLVVIASGNDGKDKEPTVLPARAGIN